MIRFNDKNLCLKAEVYYFDFIDNNAKEIPCDLFDHITKCKVCKEKIKKLKQNLDNSSNEHSQQKNNLNFLFEQCKFVGKEVICETVRPFLPLLSKESLKSNIITPITSHINKCPECCNDLMTIQELELSEDKLDKLQKIFLSNNFKYDNALVDEKLDLFVNLQWKYLSDADLESYSCSLNYAEQISDMRQQLIEKIEKTDIKDAFNCASIKAKHLFDLCFPVNFDSTMDPYEISQTSFAKHVAKCPKCLFKMQVLHHLIYDIRTRSNSSVITKFEFNTSDAGASDVGIISPGKTFENHMSQGSKTFEKHRLVINLRKFPKVAVAAMILISLSLFVTNIRTAQGLSLEQLYDKILNIKNVHIIKFSSEFDRPVEEKIISKDLDVYYVKQGDNLSFWDLNEQIFLTIPSGEENLSSLNHSQVVQIRNLLNGTFGLLPFESVQNIPKNAKWEKVEENLYQLKWFSFDASGSKVKYKWQISVKEENKLPSKVEWFIEKESGMEKRFTLQITYPTASEIEALINKTISID